MVSSDLAVLSPQAVPEPTTKTTQRVVPLVPKRKNSLASVPQLGPEQQTQTVICIDWDDTLFATSWLSTWVPDILHPPELSNEVREAMWRLEAAAARLLAVAMTLGSVHIVTNGQTGWVEGTSRIYFPNLLPLLRCVPIVSARSRFEDRFPNEPVTWKTEAFLEAMHQVFVQDGCVTGAVNLISVGDSQVERRAAAAAYRRFSKEHDVVSGTVKSVKFTGMPLLGHLRAEIDAVVSLLSQLCVKREDVDMVLQVGDSINNSNSAMDTDDRASE
eukprot:TRINITY_DN35376_c0_g1_i1.p1 TRINITY_DN35376_c0_g1~~TRINITY_DN35376_c0_g1_i1.p1  ORF type:complete len:273 (-),score=43.55 TRINITY_DN35376_c0_g1_i1:158-976(-)